MGCLDDLERRIEALERQQKTLRTRFEAHLTLHAANEALERAAATPNPLAEACVRCPVCDGRRLLDGITCEACVGIGTVPVGEEPAVDVVIDDPGVIAAVERQQERTPAPRKPRTWWIAELSNGANGGVFGPVYTEPRPGSIPVREILPGEDDRDRAIAKLAAERQKLRERGDEYRRDWECEQSRRQDADRAIASLDAENQRLQDELADTVDQMAAKDTGIAQLRADLAKLAAENESLKKSVARLSKLHDEMNGERYDAHAEVKRLTAERDVLQRQFDIMHNCLYAMNYDQIHNWMREHDVTVASDGKNFRRASYKCLELVFAAADAAREND